MINAIKYHSDDLLNFVQHMKHNADNATTFRINQVYFLRHSVHTINRKWYVVYWIAAIPMILSAPKVIHLLYAFCNFSYSCAAVDKTSTGIAHRAVLCDSWTSWLHNDQLFIESRKYFLPNVCVSRPRFGLLEFQ